MTHAANERVLVIGDDMRIFLAVVRSLGRAGKEVHAAPFDAEAPALASKYIARVHRLPDYSADPLAWRDSVLAALLQYDFQLVIPTCDRAILTLDANRDAFSKFRIAIPNRNAMTVLFDKEHTRELCRTLAIPAAECARLRTQDTARDLVARYGLPLVVKPRRSYWIDRLGTWGRVWIVDTEAELVDVLARVDEHERYLVQAYFEGVGVGVSVLANKGKILHAFQHRRLREGRGGSSSYRISEVLDPSLVNACEAICCCTQITGVCMFEFRYNLETGRWVLLEINARFWGSLPLPVSLGVDFPVYLYDLMVHGRGHTRVAYPAGVRSRNLLLDGYNLVRGIARLKRSEIIDNAAAFGDFLLQPVRWMIGRERSDSFVPDDLRPAFREVAAFFRRSRTKTSPNRGRAGHTRRRAAVAISYPKPHSDPAMTKKDTRQDDPPILLLDRSEEFRFAGAILSRVCALLDRSGVAYCLLNGDQVLSERFESDVDCIVDRRVSADGLLSLFVDNRDALDADVVRNTGCYFVFAGQDQTGAMHVLHLDLSADCAADGVIYCDGESILRSRRRRHNIAIPAIATEFHCHLARSLAKGRLDRARVQRLGDLFRKDAAGCEAVICDLLSPPRADLVLSCLRSSNWAVAEKHITDLQNELKQSAMARDPPSLWSEKVRRIADRVAKLRRPDGIHIAFLGPDGAGKSTVCDLVEHALADVFAHHICQGFAPSLSRLVRGAQPTDQPHALRPRSYWMSITKAGYWLAYHTWSYAMLRRAKARATLIVNDRHFIDILVDARRYRYGGPPWLLRAIHRLIPAPDLVVLLDAPPEVLQSRKQEVPFAETKRQREAYLALIRRIPNGHVVDASQPLDRVVAEVCRLVLHRQAQWIAPTHGIRSPSTAPQLASTPASHTSPR